MNKKITIQAPHTAPFGGPISAAGVEQVWDTFVKPDQLKGEPQSIEMRMLMGILRAVFAGLEADLTKTKFMHSLMQKRGPAGGGLDYTCACGWSPLEQLMWRFSIHDGRSDDKQREWVEVHISTANELQK